MDASFLPRVRIIAFGLTLCLASMASQSATICTFISNSPEMPVPMDQRRSTRAVQSQVLPKFIERGDKAAASGQLAEATYYYMKVFQPFQYSGMHIGRERCADPRIYRDAVQKLQRVASEHARQLMSKGHYLSGDSPTEVPGVPGGALDLLLIGHDYGAFIEHSLEYAAIELRERDIDGTLEGMVSYHLEELESARNIGVAYAVSGLANDVAPPLHEEEAAAEKLAGFTENLRAHLAPLYPKITDYWLAEEVDRHRALLGLGSELEQNLFVSRAAGALSEAIRRLRRHNNETERLKTRGNKRGEAFMQAQQYELARAYFKAVNNDSRAARAKALASRDAEAKIHALQQALRTDVEALRKSEDDRAAFEEDADDMAAEFGFDVEE